MSGSLGLLATAVSSFSLGLFVYLKNRQGSIHRSWLRLSLAMTVWALATVGMRHAPGIGWAFLWARIAQGAFSLIAPFFLQFVLALSNRPGQLEGWLRWNLRIGSVFALLAFTPLIFKEIQTDLALRFYPGAGPLYGVFALWFLLLTLTCLGILLKGYRAQVGFRRNQLKFVILASFIGGIATLSTIPLTFGIPVTPMGEGLLIFYLLMSYTIVRFRLMDISIVVKNTLLYACLYSILVGLFVVVVVFLGQWLFYGPQALDRRVLWMCLVALSIVTLLVGPLDAWLRQVTDRLLFQKKYEWQKTLKEASKGMTKVTSVDRLLKLMAHFIGMRLRVTHVGILQRASDHYTIQVSRGREKCPLKTTVSRENPLTAWLEEKKEVLTRDEVFNWLRSEKLFPRRTVLRRSLEEIRDQMEKLHAHVCVPAFSKSQMVGILLLGEKLSGDPYSQEDLDVLFTLANEGAIALENAQLYEQLFLRMRQIEDLYRREHRLFIHTAIALAAAVDARDPYTHGHTERCTEYAMRIAQELGPQPEIADLAHFKENLKIAALLHDIGKIGVPDEILRKKGKLTPKEIEKMREHPVVGAIILQPIKGMEGVARAVKAHHERFDGTGYPDGLKGSEIPLLTRIISVADTFDTMTTDRPYRRRLSESVAVKEIASCAGTQFDPVVVQAFLRAYEKGLITLRPVETETMLA